MQDLSAALPPPGTAAPDRDWVVTNMGGRASPSCPKHTQGPNTHTHTHSREMRKHMNKRLLYRQPHAQVKAQENRPGCFTGRQAVDQRDRDRARETRDTERAGERGVT